ncbi:hypothetical protein ACHAQH_005914 [Verticillium albo-atrum]
MDDTIASRGAVMSASEHQIKNWCEPDNAGGKYEGKDYVIEVTNDPDWRPVRRRATRSDLRTETMSLEEYETMREEEWEIQLNKLNSSRHARRQDDSFLATLIARSIANNAERIDVTGPMDPGITETWTFSESQSVGFDVNVEMGVSLFEIFSASMSVSVGYEGPVSVENSQTFSSETACGTNAVVVYWVPL